jgi:hypothetical protein
MCTGTNYWSNVQVTSGQFHLSSACFLQPSGTTTVCASLSCHCAPLHSSHLAIALAPARIDDEPMSRTRSSPPHPLLTA